MSKRVPVLTPAEYRTRSIQLRVEVAEIAWSLVVAPAPIDAPRRWRALSSDETADIFDRLFAAIARHALTDRAKIDGPHARPRA